MSIKKADKFLFYQKEITICMFYFQHNWRNITTYRCRMSLKVRVNFPKIKKIVDFKETSFCPGCIKDWTRMALKEKLPITVFHFLSIYMNSKRCWKYSQHSTIQRLLCKEGFYCKYSPTKFCYRAKHLFLNVPVIIT